MNCAFAGGDGIPRRADLVEGGLEIVPLEMYDSARAKIEANLRWLFAKAYGEGNHDAICGKKKLNCKNYTRCIHL
uniref:CASAMP N-terminal domain-containing protein n=1 Tax=Cyprinus carpio TaxID=7962 RepID=A0A8C1LYD2_CYPCA